MFNTSPDRQIRIERLAKFLRDLPIREVATYEALSDHLGEDVKSDRIALIRARKVAERETGMRFATVHGEGVKKLDAAAIPGIGEEVRKGIARKARRQSERLVGLKYNDIDGPMQARIDAERSILGAIAATANVKAEKVEIHTSTGPIVPSRIFQVSQE